MNRRHFLSQAGVAAVGVGLVASTTTDVFAQGKKHVHHAEVENPYKKAILTTSECARNGELCIAHCVELISAGNKEMLPCLKAAQNMVVMCDSFRRLLSLNTLDKAQIKALASVCRDICKKCEEACREHANHHSVCNACLESCKACEKACAEIAA